MIRLHIPMMTCGACARRIAQAIRSVDPAADVETDVPDRRVSVRTSATAPALAAAIAEAGYEALVA